MLAEVPAKRGDGKSSFFSLARYIESERDRIDPITGEVIGHGTSIDTNCLSRRTAWAEMWGVAGQNARVKDPVYHAVVSWRSGEEPSDEQCFAAARAAIKAVGMEGHQYVAAVHRDTANVHVHVMVNRIHPETYRAVYPHRDFFALDKCMRELELEQGWSHDNGPFAVHERDGEIVVDWAKGSAKEWRQERSEQGKVRLPEMAKKMEAMTGNESLASYVQGIPKGHILRTLAKPDADWQRLHAALFASGLTIKPKGQGLAIYSATDPKQTPVKASLMHESLGAGRLIKRLGPYQPMTQAIQRIVAEMEPAIRYSDKLPKRDADTRLERRKDRAKEREALGERFGVYLQSWKEAKAPAKALMTERHMAAQQALTDKHKEERERIARGEDLSGVLRPVDDLTALILERVTRTDAVFSMKDLEREVATTLTETGKNTPEVREKAMANVDAAAALVLLHPGDEASEARYSTKAMVRMELRIAEATTALHARSKHFVDPKIVERVLSRYPTASDEQKNAVRHLILPNHVACMVGDAGTGKSFTSKMLKEIYEEAGYRVLGTAAMGKAVDGLRQANGLSEERCRTLASWELSWSKKRADNPDKLGAKDVMLVDEAGLLSSRQMLSLLQHVAGAGAKVAFMGDQKQLAPIEAGAPFRVMMERTGAAELTDIIRQKEQWAREASMQFARGEHITDAFNAYDQRGHVHLADDAQKSLESIATAWLADFDTDQADPARAHLGPKERIVLAYRNADVRVLNESLRDALKARGVLGDSFKFKTTEGVRDFAVGDRVVFTQNDKRLGVQNGVLGTVEEAADKRLAIRTDAGELRTIDQDRYRNIDYGYAITVHKSQGVTLDRTYGLATSGIDRALMYVMGTRHRLQFKLFANREEFMPKVEGMKPEALGAEERDQLIKANMIDTLSQFNVKESTQDFANRRGFDGEKVVQYQLDQAKALANQLEAFSDPKKGLSKEDQAITKSVLSMVQADEKQKLQERFKAEREAFRGEKPQDYREWVADRAQEGDRSAISQLRGWAYQEKRAEAALKREEAAVAKIPHVTTDLEGAFEPASPRQVIDDEAKRGNKVTFTVNRQTGSVAYQINDQQAFTDSGQRIAFDNEKSRLDPDVIEAGLRLAAEKFRDDKGNPGGIKIYGGEAQRRELSEASLAVAVERELDVRFADAELEQRRQDMLAERRRAQEVSQGLQEAPIDQEQERTDRAIESLVATEPVRMMTASERRQALTAPEPTLDRHSIIKGAVDAEVLKLDDEIQQRFLDERGARPVERDGLLAGPASRREIEKWDRAFEANKAERYEKTNALTHHLWGEDPKAEAWRQKVLDPHETAHQARIKEWSTKRAQATRESQAAELAERQARRAKVLGTAVKEQEKVAVKQLEPAERERDETTREDLDKSERTPERDAPEQPTPTNEREARRQRILSEAQRQAAQPTQPKTRDIDDDNLPGF